MRSHIRVLALTLLSLYIVYHAFSGRLGLISFLHLRESIAVNEKTIKKLELEQDRLENLVHLLRPGSMSSDLLEEQARLLGFGFKDDKIVLQ